MAFDRRESTNRLLDILTRSSPISTTARSGLGTQATREEATQPGGFQRLISRLTSPLVDVPDLPGGPVGELAERGIEELSSPVGLVSAALVPFTGGTSLGLRGAAGLAARGATRLAGEAAIGGAASLAAGEVAERTEGLPGPLSLAATLGTAGLVGGGASAVTRRAGATGRALAEPTEEILRNNVRIPEAGDLAVAISRAKRIPRREQQRLVAQQQAQQSRRAEAVRQRVLASGRSGQEADRAARAATAGAFRRAQFETPVIDQQTVDNIYSYVNSNQSPLRPLSKFQAVNALDDILAGAIPAPSDLSALEEALGRGVVEAVLTKQGFGPKLLTAINAPRSLVASTDLSAPLRQGIILAPAHPRAFADSMRAQLKAFADEDYFEQAMEALRVGDKAELRRQAGLDLTGTLTNQEEVFLGSGAFRGAFSKTLAGQTVKASERAYTLFLNKLRADVFDAYVDNLQRSGTYSLGRAKEYARFLNLATGRGAPREVTQGFWGKVLNAAFFSPQYTISRFLAPTALFTTDPVVRNAVLKDFGAFLGTGMATLSLVKMAHNAGLIPADVELDPRSSDFGKVRLGGTRWDFWGGYQQIARSTAQALTAQRRTSTGRIVDASRAEIIGRFFQSKTSPLAGLVVDVTRGETFLGDELDFSDPNIVADQVKDRLLPFAIADIEEGYRTGRQRGALLAVPGVFGVGVTSFLTFGETKDKAAQEVYGRDYRDLTGAEQRVIDQHPDVLAKEAEFSQKAGETFSDAVEQINTERIQQEQIFMARLASGQLDRRGFADAIEEAQLRSAVRRNQAAVDFGLPEVGDPASPLQAALAGWRDLFEMADLGAEEGIITGQIDWERFDELEREFLAGLSEEQRTFIEERRRPDHDPTVQWYFNNKDYIDQSGYYDVTDEIFERFRARIQRSFPDVTSYNQLRNLRFIAAAEGDRVTETRIKKLLSNIDRRVSKERERMRRRDPKLDAALWHNGRVTTTKTARARRMLPTFALDE